MFGRRQQHISKALIQQHLRDSDSEDDTDIEDTGHCRLEELLADVADREVRLESESFPAFEDRRDSHKALGVGSTPPDTAFLERIREGRGPRDQSPEDVLATLRDESIQRHKTESYGDMKSVLLAWNKRATIDRRANLLKAPAGGSEKKIADFKDRELLDILVIVWANIRITIPDLDDELKLLTMTALINEVESKLHASNAVKLSSIARSLSVARLQLDATEVERLEKKMQAFENRLCETVIKKVMDKIRTGRRELTVIKLAELQKLTELQSAQKWAAHAALGSSQQRQFEVGACDQAASTLQRVLQHQTPELDAHIQAVQSNANALAGISANLLSRAADTGFALEDRTSSTSKELANVDVKAYVMGGIADIFNARDQAARLLEHMDAVDSHLEVMLDAAKHKYRAYDDVFRLVEQAENEYDEEIRVAENLGFGARRESILLMCRDLQRAKQAS
ncbi:hypothetical protein E8E11_010383 [Didymella keratinophila]|nr:hypothetical protein E8E11_010383 [Didymella keratinophila]